MIKHFLGILFWSFIGFVVFVNLFQFSGALLPFENDSSEIMATWDHSYFGFSSLFKFLSELGSGNNTLNIGLNFMKKGVTIIQSFSIDDFVEFYDNLAKMEEFNPVMVVVYLFTFLLNFLNDLLVLPIATLLALFIILIGLVLFLVNLITIFFSFILGYYNTPYSPVITL